MRERFPDVRYILGDGDPTEVESESLVCELGLTRKRDTGRICA